MSYYRKSYYSDNDGCLIEIICIIVSIALLFAIMIGFNTCTASEWNNGVCPNCRVEYELEAVYKGLRYYECPKCHNEVERYGGR